MANIMDYIEWRGDLSISQTRFNEVDNVILSLLSYIDFKNIVVFSGEKGIPLGKAAEKFFEKYKRLDKKVREAQFQTAVDVFEKAAKSKRFKNLILSYYVDEIDMEKESQFCALMIDIGRNENFISFRGTDESIVGWKENFNMSFVEATESQKKAVEYLNKVGRLTTTKLRVGGHSKGGNLAVYASIYCDKEIQSRIRKIYNNDGPGFTEKMVEKEAYLNIKSKVLSLFPEGSIVGMCLEHEGDIAIVKSHKIKLQHDPINWEIRGKAFIKADELRESAKFFHKTIMSWIEKTNPDQRQKFVDTLYEILKENDINTVMDLENLSPDKFFALLKSGMELNQQREGVIEKSVKLFIDEGGKTIKEGIDKVVDKALPVLPTKRKKKDEK